MFGSDQQIVETFMSDSKAWFLFSEFHFTREPAVDFLLTDSYLTAGLVINEIPVFIDQVFCQLDPLVNLVRRPLIRKRPLDCWSHRLLFHSFASLNLYFRILFPNCWILFLCFFFLFLVCWSYNFLSLVFYFSFIICKLKNFRSHIIF